MSAASRERVVRLTTRGVAFGVFLLLVAGALVTSTGSGLAVPDWPLSYGRLMPPMVGGILYEHGHRLIAAAVSMLVGVEMAVLFWGERRKAVRWLGLAAFGAILLQALLGGLTVLLLLPPIVSSAHAGLAQIVFALAVSAAWMTWPGWTSAGWFARVRPENERALARAYRAALAAAVAIYVQILLGAVMRHTGAGLAIPDFPTAFGGWLPRGGEWTPQVAIHLAHRIGAVAAALLVLVTLARLDRAADVCPVLGRLGAGWGILVFLQVGLGAFSIWTRKAVFVTVAHLAVGALCLAGAVLLALTLGKAERTAAGLAGASLDATAPTAPLRRTG